MEELGETKDGGQPVSPLFEVLPDLAQNTAWVPLGEYPTPLEPAPGLSLGSTEVLLKREDLSSPAYGGNKVRTLEFLFGQAKERGAGASGEVSQVDATKDIAHAHPPAQLLYSSGIGCVKRRDSFLCEGSPYHDP